ncbi:MAG TPA: MerR family transcriptional regulator [Steroidobacteraceae bacterium]|nr:MerR family transcriptional regulator [Steroidobacteraceae bacterium]
MAAAALLTIGALAARARVSTSLLRFYEREGLLRPARRSASGYRLYGAEAEQTLLFIRRAQRLGLSLDDIRAVLAGRRGAGITGRTVVGIAEQRFLEIERRLTELLVLRHELELFLDDLAQRVGRLKGGGGGRLYRDLLEHVCGDAHGHVARSSMTRLMRRIGCSLADAGRESLFAALRGRHVHVWREDGGYTVLIPGHDAAVGAALRQLQDAEAGCTAHVDLALAESTEGWMLTVRGDGAFLFAQLFLALEAADT